MRIIDKIELCQKLENALIDMNIRYDKEYLEIFKGLKDSETTDTAREVLDVLYENIDISDRTDTPLCQDTGIVVERL